jgi:hypothetical protein
MPGLGDAVKEKRALKYESGPKAPRGVPRGERGSPRATPPENGEAMRWRGEEVPPVARG